MCDKNQVCLTVLGNFDLHELELDIFINCITISLQIESPGEVKLSCECASCSVTSTRWDAEGGPLVNRVECDFDSIWEVFVGNWSTHLGEGKSTFHNQIVACLTWVVARICYLHTIADSSYTNSSKKVRVGCGRVLKVYTDGDNDDISREFPSGEQGHLDQQEKLYSS